LDSNVLASGLVRTLVLLCGQIAGYRAVWSPFAEAEASRHEPAGATPIEQVRSLYALTTVPDRPSPRPLSGTDEKDTPILGSAAAAGATFLVTENVKHFDVDDLAMLCMSAVHPDLFLTTRVTVDEYRFVLDAIAEKRLRDPRTPRAIHETQVALKLPHLFAAHRDALGAHAEPTKPARLQLRGVTCLVCAQPQPAANHLTGGLCQWCRQGAAT
jgi:hypothetical protein